MSLRAALPSPRDRVRLGASGLSVSPICIGHVGDPDVVLAAVDQGINFFFVTADLHWPIYEPLRVGLTRLLARGAGVRDDIVVASASYTGNLAFSFAAFHEVLHFVPALGRIDVLISGAVGADGYEPRAAAFAEYRAHPSLGARAIGASFHDRKAACRAVNAGAVEVAFVRYNTLHPGARRDIFPQLAAGRTTAIFNFNSTHGHADDAEWRALGLDDDVWRPAITDHYRFALSTPAIDGILCSFDHVAQLAELAPALERGPLDEEDQGHMLELAVRQKAARDAQPFTWRSPV